MSREAFIEDLVNDLEPVRPAVALPQVAVGWAILAWLFVTFMIFTTGTLRPGAVSALTSAPLLAIEFVFAILAGLCALIAGLELGVPGTENRWQLIAPVGFFATGWAAIAALPLIDPTFQADMIGKRPLCAVQTLVFAIPPLGLALFALKQRALFKMSASGFFLGIGAAAVPAATMQLACIPEPIHALTHHLAPVAVVGVIAAFAARSLRRRG